MPAHQTSDHVKSGHVTQVVKFGTIPNEVMNVKCFVAWNNTVPSHKLICRAPFVCYVFMAYQV